MRTCGVLMHISSLPSDYGVGTMGKEAYKFIDFLRKSGQTYWQILPINPTGYGDSPYQSFSTFAGNPYFIDLDILHEEGMLRKDDYADVKWSADESLVGYGILFKERYKVFEKLHENFKPSEEYRSFCVENQWLDDYALFMAVKDAYGGKPYYEWEKAVKYRQPDALETCRRKYSDRIEFHKILQYFFYRQWNRLKKYAEKSGVKIIGDIPIYVAQDSADVWANPKVFMLDEELLPTEVAGCPPDDFSKDGQLWGNPVYDWKYLKTTDYNWWCRRLKHCANVYDVVRLDHFRGFEAYYCIKYRAKNARNGVWRKGPGIDFFKSVEKQIGKVEFIAEDLGFLTDGVRKLLSECGFPGMKVLQFGFDGESDSDYLVHNYPQNCVAYTGTHDNTTIEGWFENADEKSKEFAIEYLRLNKTEGYNWGMMKSVMASAADTAIVTMQDLLGLGDTARMNTPSTLGGNWRWRALKSDFSDELSEKLRHFTDVYRRLPKPEEEKQNEFI